MPTNRLRFLFENEELDQRMLKSRDHKSESICTPSTVASVSFCSDGRFLAPFFPLSHPAAQHSRQSVRAGYARAKEVLED